MRESGAEELPPLHAWHALVHKDELPTDGGGRVLSVSELRLAAFRIDDAVHVIDDQCPHEGASLGEGVVIDGEVTCPWHGWHFDVRSGMSGDGLASCVAVHRTRVRSDGWVEVALCERPLPPADCAG